MALKHKKVTAPVLAVKEENKHACPGCGWQWDLKKLNTGICPDCDTRYKTSGWPSFNIEWFPEIKEQVLKLF